jgi:hypothetical protein
MSEQAPRSVSAALADHAAIDAAVRRAAREAVLSSARAGLAVATTRDGKVVWVPPEEILARFATETAPVPPVNGSNPAEVRNGVNPPPA